MHTNRKFIKTLHILELLARFVSISLLVYIFISHASNFLIQDTIQFDNQIFDPVYLRFLCLTAIACATAGLILSSIRKEKISITFYTLPVREKIAVVISALFFSIFFINNITSLFHQIFILISTVLLSVLFPRIIGFYVLPFSIPKIAYHDLLQINKIKGAILVVVSIIILASGYIFSDIVASYITGSGGENNLTKNTLYISSIFPKKTPPALPVQIDGSQFGWKNNEDYKLMTETTEMPVDEWTNERITATIPLSMQEGMYEVWVERPDENNPQNILSSNRVELQIFSRFVLYPDVDDSKIERGFKKLKQFVFFNIPVLHFLF